jgi:transposase-like protein
MFWDDFCMQGRERADRQLLDAELLVGHLVPAGSMFAFLAGHRQELFGDEDFADLFPSVKGRPSVPASVMASVMVLQVLHDYSDAEAAEAARCDLRWKAACGFPLDHGGFDPSTLVYWRRRLAKSDRPHRQCCVGRSQQAGDWFDEIVGKSSAFAGFRFPREVIAVAVRWYLRYGLSYRDVEELLAERGVTVDHATIYRWVHRFTPEFIEAARMCRHAPGDRWSADETYVKVAGRWTYLYRAIDQHGQVIDVLLSARRDLAAARRFFILALRSGTVPAEVTTDRAPAYPRVLDELIPSALHIVERYANNPVEADHGRLKARLRPMRGLKRDRSARIISVGHAFVQDIRRGHYELATDIPARHRIHAAFDELAMAI